MATTPQKSDSAPLTSTVDHLADSVSKMGISTSYGDPIDVGGTTITPVALAWFGFGLGQDDGDEKSTGAGAGGASIPVGAYMPGLDGPVFRPNIIALLAVSIPAMWVGGRALARVIRALKK